MRKSLLPVMLTAALGAALFAGCDADEKEAAPDADASSDPSELRDPDDEPTMPEMTYTATETNDQGEVVLDVVVEFTADGSWERSGDETASGQLAPAEVERLDELLTSEQFPFDEEEYGDVACATVMPEYWFSIEAGEERASNGNGGCTFSDAVSEIAQIVQDAADVGPTLDEIE